jgi:hypothetical protein
LFPCSSYILPENGLKLRLSQGAPQQQSRFDSPWQSPYSSEKIMEF